MKKIADYFKFDYTINPEYVLIDTYNRDEDDYVEYFKEYCEGNDYTIKGDGTDMEGLYLGGKVTFWDWYYETTGHEENEFWYNFK